MITETLNKEELLAAIDESSAKLVGLLSSIDSEKVNAVPYQDSWTPGQLFRHVTKSTNGIAKAMAADSQPAQRDPSERIPELKKVFLDFSTKLKSPDFIIPEPGPYQKETSIQKLHESFARLKESANHTNLDTMVEGMPLGSITKWEILHFVLYHTQRHTHQMKKIADALNAGE